MSNKDKDPDVISVFSGQRCLFPTFLKGCLKWTKVELQDTVLNANKATLC